MGFSSIFSPTASGAEAPEANPRTAFSISPEQKARLLRALEEPDKEYDPAEQMLRKPFHSPGYHTTLSGGMVHPTRDALGYAVALLDTGESARIERAVAILRRVVALQDRNPANKTCGIWSWFLEEPLTKMSPPDWNWADFCGVQLLQVAHDHRSRIPANLMKEIDTAILYAARAIEKRNVGPDYTNIAVMGSYVTLVAGELYQDEELKAYGLKRLKRFYDYTLALGSFNEYNSPTYTVVALSELGRMRLHVRDAGAREMVETLYRMAWKEMASHFHAPTRQWAGPHSRAYSTLLGDTALALIERATEGRAAFGVAANTPSLTEARLPLPCPADLASYFTTLESPRTVVETFNKSNPPVVGTTYHAPRFTLGTVNHGDLWNQRRNLLAYWGTPEAPSYLHLRFLKNGYDLAAAQFTCTQREGRALAAINFATDGGDTHISLTKLKDGVVRAKDLRLRFELGGAAAKRAPSAPKLLGEPARLSFGDLGIELSVPHAQFGECAGRWEAGQDTEQGIAFLDVLLYKGEEKEFRLKEIEDAALGVAVQFGAAGAPVPAIQAEVREGKLKLGWERMRVEVPVKPAPGRVLKQNSVAQP